MNIQRIFVGLLVGLTFVAISVTDITQLFNGVSLTRAAAPGETIIIPNNGQNHSIIYENSIAFDSNGFAGIAVKNRQTEGMQYIHCQDMDCSSKSVVTVDNTNNTGITNSVAIGSDNFARLVYDENPGGIIRFARCLNISCSSKTITNIGSGYPNKTQIYMGADGYARIVYDNGDIYFVQCTSDDCSTRTTVSVGTGSSPSFVLKSNNYAQITFQSNTSELTFVNCYSSNCGSKDVSVVDTSADNISISHGGDGKAIISYRKTGGANDLMFARCTEDSCYTPQIVTIDSANSVGNMSKIGKGFDGYARISYLDSTTGLIKYAACRDFTCTTTNIISINTPNTNPTLFQGMAVAPDGFSRIVGYSFGSSGGNLVNYIRCFNSTCSANDDPLAPTDLFSNNTPPGAQGGEINPEDLHSGNISFSAVYHDPDGDNGNKYQLQISTEQQFATTFYDSGVAGTNMTNVADGARTVNITPAIGYAANKTYYWRIRFWDVNGNIGFYSDRQFFTIPDTTSPYQQGLPSSLRGAVQASGAVDADGFMRYVAYDQSLGGYAHVLCTNALCNNPTVTLINAPSEQGGQSVNILVGSDNLSRIVYNGLGSGPSTIEYVQCYSPDCSSNAAHTFLNHATQLRFALDSNDMPRILAGSTQNGTLKFIECTAQDCSSSNITTLPGIALSFSNYMTLGLVMGLDDFGRIVYGEDNATSKPYFIQCLNSECSQQNTTELESNNFEFYNLTMDIGDDGFAKIMIPNYSAHELYYYSCSSDDCSTNTKYNLGSITNLLGFDIGSNGFPRYTLFNGSELTYNVCTGSGCVTPQTISVANIPFASGGMQLDLNDKPHFWFLDSSLEFQHLYCTSSTCSTNAAPSSPSGLYANIVVETAQSGRTDPNDLSSNQIVFSAVYNDPDSTDTASKYQLQIADDNMMTNIIYDSSEADLGLSLAVGERVPDIITTYTFQEGQQYYWRIKFYDNTGTEGAYSSISSFAYVDLISPFASSVPPDADTLVAIDSNVTLLFEDAETGVDSATIDVSIAGVDAVLDGICQPGYNCSITAQNTGYQVSINPDSNFAPNSTITVDFSVSDNAAVPNVMTNGQISFSTAGTPDTSAPVVGAQLPAVNAINVVPSTPISFEVTDIGGVDQTSIEVQITSTAAVTAGVCQSGFTCEIVPITNGYKVTIQPASSFANAQTVSVSYDVADLASSPNTFSGTWSFTTSSPAPIIPGASTGNGGGGGSSSAPSTPSEPSNPNQNTITPSDNQNSNAVANVNNNSALQNTNTNQSNQQVNSNSNTSNTNSNIVNVNSNALSENINQNTPQASNSNAVSNVNQNGSSQVNQNTAQPSGSTIVNNTRSSGVSFNGETNFDTIPSSTNTSTVSLSPDFIGVATHTSAPLVPVTTTEQVPSTFIPVEESTVAASLKKDSDGDGVSDDDERLLFGTDPLHADTMSEKSTVYIANLPDNTVMNETAPAVLGSTKPNHTVQLYEVLADGEKRLLGKTQSDSKGIYKVKPETALSEGMHILQVGVTNENGAEIESITKKIIVDTVSHVDLPVLKSVCAQAGFIKIKGQSSSGTVIQAIFESPIQTALIKVEQSDGTFTMSSPAAYEKGTYTVTVNAMDASGKRSKDVIVQINIGDDDSCMQSHQSIHAAADEGSSGGVLKFLLLLSLVMIIAGIFIFTQDTVVYKLSEAELKHVLATGEYTVANEPFTLFSPRFIGFLNMYDKGKTAFGRITKRENHGSTAIYHFSILENTSYKGKTVVDGSYISSRNFRHM
ncbi:MAG: Ig-like domain-containing protein [Candidatus Gracilibacteria bacterium]